MAEVISSKNVEASLEVVGDEKHGYDHHHHGNEKPMELDQVDTDNVVRGRS
jgi:hypothetical protein